ncbi:MAG: hypothetical protein ACRCZF_23590 [Gemmataceae bacterium]
MPRKRPKPAEQPTEIEREPEVPCEYSLGQRVVVLTGYWLQSAIGTIQNFPPAFEKPGFSFVSPGGLYRGPSRVYWVEFDTPIRDCNLDGPYDSGMASADELKPLDPP